ncbi:hypothetical protein C8J55DRAFT_528413 [Lentinula edodes]|uniref:Uncharacterized protein n=1 Tax=Lentinula lateritia TaxID=40482 RepID=A0A9W9DDX8_9AGAR|nr:hypothetical protein C8J55DRAFT_528413 [Lentinula edodes]
MKPMSPFAGMTSRVLLSLSICGTDCRIAPRTILHSIQISAKFSHPQLHCEAAALLRNRLLPLQGKHVLGPCS